MKRQDKNDKVPLFDNARSDSDSSSSSESSSSEEENKLSVNKKYAKAYQERKQREELRQIQQDRGDIDSDESSSEEEDEDGNLLTKSMNIQFLKTMKALRSKESSIYDPKAQFFDSPSDKEDTTNSDSENRDGKPRKAKKFKDVLRDQILEQMDGEDETNAMEKEPLSQHSKLAYDAQQEELRKDFLKKSGRAHDSSSDEEGDDSWMVVKKKAEPSEEENEIAAGIDELANLSKANKLGANFNDPRGEVQDGEQFLLDYIKNKKWVDKGASIGTDDDESSVEDMDRADDFEASYNFRFEQVAEETAASGASLSNQMYARGQTMTTLRRQDTTRKDSRLARKERKAAERKAKEEQLKRLKNAKRTEMKQKLGQIKTVLGAVDDEALDEAALMKLLEGDFDPEKFEQSMQQAYGDDFYQREEAEWKTDKDVVTFLANDEENGVEINDTSCYDGDEQADVEETLEDGGADDSGGEDWADDEMGDDMLDGGEGGTAETQLEKKFRAKMQNELYKLDYEDIVAGMPTRFKYRQVEANDYGLTAQDILMARDSTLKQFVSLKKMAPYNEKGEFRPDTKKRRRFRQLLQQDIQEQMGPEQENGSSIRANATSESQDNEPEKKKRRRLKKGKKRQKVDLFEEKEDEGRPEESPKEADNGETEKVKRRRKKKGKKGDHASAKEEERVVDPKDDRNSANASNEPKLSDVYKKKSDKTRKKKKKKSGSISALPASRLSSYGL